MTSHGTTIEFASQQLALLPERAIWWSRHNTLLVADMHLGKSATFRSAAIPVPDTTQADLHRLDRVLHTTRSTTLIILGDLLHARRGRCPRLLDMFAAWRARHRELRIVLIRGNHDRAAGDPPAAWQIECRDEPYSLDGLDLLHDPAQVQSIPALAGHLHPAVRIGRHGDQVRCPCFVLQPQTLILPAFGSFIDGQTVRSSETQTIFAIAGSEIFRLSGRSLGRHLRR